MSTHITSVAMNTGVPSYLKFHCPRIQLPVVSHGLEANDPLSDISVEGQ